MTTVGVISDTHGLLRVEALQALRGVQLIAHAGDIGAAEVIKRLETIAPVVAIRGNIDKAAWVEPYPPVKEFTIQGRRFHMLHNLKALDFDPASAGVDVVISGHSHKPAVAERDGVLYVNPGSAGPRRFSLPIAIATIEIEAGRIAAQVIHLPV